MKIMISIILNLAFIMLIAPGCNKDNGDLIDTRNEPSEIYKSCCGAEPVEFTVLDSSYVYVPNAFTPQR